MVEGARERRAGHTEWRGVDGHLAGALHLGYENVDTRGEGGDARCAVVQAERDPHAHLVVILRAGTTLVHNRVPGHLPLLSLA